MATNGQVLTFSARLLALCGIVRHGGVAYESISGPRRCMHALVCTAPCFRTRGVLLRRVP
ncbi:hypothetical protein PR001_g25593 [Phytophthora rubi]|uniref:Uncharacterized protein n=1 Tax=Phytophthora rubi TaxID=129364 RepID=A0A6A3I6H7_9STRA|nr:hypothetical protein PR002_g25808 [Phytophthora rubi]KAE8975814.1 hypothetical protein PR001_g25593 [Phytophthora rubi]